jgi:Ca2+-binding EF-hand superfamily protein
VIRVDEDCDGYINSEGLMDLFESLGHALSVDDAMLLMKKMAAGAHGEYIDRYDITYITKS